MSEQFAPIVEGLRYQLLVSWFELLVLLDETSPYDHGFVEHPEADAVDDVTLHPKPGAGVPAKFIQVKWHVDQRSSYSFESLITVSSGARSLLKKLFDTWRELVKQDDGNLEIHLVSNWTSAPDLGAYLRGRADALDDSFFDDKPNNALKKTRASWMSHLGATVDELDRFCRTLRFRLGAPGILQMEERLDDRLGRFGLRLGPDARAIALDEMKTWIEIGGARKRVSQDDLLDVIKRRKLRTTHPLEPSVRLWVHGWAKRAHDQEPTIELDWTAHFDRETRRLPEAHVWRDVIFKDLATARKAIEQIPGGGYIDLRGKLPLSVITAIGAKLSEAAGYSFRVEQTTGGETALWRSNAGASSRQLVAVEKSNDVAGADLLLVLSITGDAMPTVEGFLKTVKGPFRAVIDARPDNGASWGSITSDQDAVALAIRVKELMKDQRGKLGVRRTHLILYAPAAFCLFLGQQLNAVGDVVLYEESSDRGYQVAVTLQT